MKSRPSCIILSAFLMLSAFAPVACKKKKDNAAGPVTSGGDSIAPNVTLSSAGCGNSVQGSVMLSASASDNVGITKVEFLADGSVIATDSEAPFEFTWDTSSASTGQHTIAARAYDAAGNASASQCQMTVMSSDGGGGDDNITPAPPRKRVFVTNAAISSGGFGGLSGADSFCANAASARGLGGSWVAWMSDSMTNAIDRINDVGPWYFVDQQTLVFSSKAAITSGPATPLQVTEFGTILTADHTEGVWTGTQPNGTMRANNTCSDWTNTASTGSRGDPRATGPEWTQFSSNVPCTGGAHLYCFEQ
jgi:hypothetical protein